MAAARIGGIVGLLFFSAGLGKESMDNEQRLSSRVIEAINTELQRPTTKRKLQCLAKSFLLSDIQQHIFSAFVLLCIIFLTQVIILWKLFRVHGVPRV